MAEIPVTASGAISPSVDTSKVFIELDPHKNLNRNIWCGRLLKVAAITTLIAYTILAMAASIASGFFAPIYLPIVITLAIILADLVINVAYRPINELAKAFRAQAKLAQGVIEELDKLGESKKNNFVEARCNYFKNYAQKCDTKLIHYTNVAKTNLPSKEASLEKMGKWLDKKLSTKCIAAYCDAFMKNKTIKKPEIIAKTFLKRNYEKKFLNEDGFLKLASGTTLADHDIEKLTIEQISDRIVSGK